MEKRRIESLLLLFLLLPIRQGRIQEFLIGGGGGVQTLVQKGLLNFFGGKLLNSPPPSLPPVAVVRYNSLAPYRVLEFHSRRMHPWNILLLCLVTKIIQISLNIPGIWFSGKMQLAFH